ncbi:MAG: hypothetical protein ACYDC6_04905 [Acidobacteriaceae bacterium]
MVPLPGIFKRVDLRTRPAAILFREQHVVVLPRVERRVQIHQIDRPVAHIAPQHIQIVAVVKLVFIGHWIFIVRVARRVSGEAATQCI